MPSSFQKSSIATPVTVANGGTGSGTAATGLSNLGGAPLASPTFTGTVTTPAIKITTGASLGKVLTSDADGDATWEAPSVGGAVFESRTSDYTAEVANLGKCWIRTDIPEAVRIVTNPKSISILSGAFVTYGPSTLNDAGFHGGSSNAIAYGGYSGGAVSSCSVFNGATWSTGGSLAVTLQSAANGGGNGSGAVSHHGSIGGSPVTSTRIYNGTSWSNGNPASYTYGDCATGGSQTASISVGGAINATLSSSFTNEYNGTTWSQGGDFGFPMATKCAGDGTDAISFGGTYYFNTYISTTSKYNGTSWSSSAAMLIITNTILSGGKSTTDSIIISPNASTLGSVINKFNGTAWSVFGNRAISSQFGRCSGGATDGIIIGSTSLNTNLGTMTETYTTYKVDTFRFL